MNLILNDPAFLGFLTSVIFLVCLFMYGFYYILKRQSELQKKEREFDKKASKLIEKAQEHAEEILREAAQNATSLLNQSKSFKENLEAELKNALNVEVDNYRNTLNDKLASVVTTYQKVLEQTGTIYAQSIKDANIELKQAEQKNSEAFKNLLDDQTLTAKFYIQRKVNEELDKAKKEIEDYKEEERKKIQDSVKNIIISLSENVFENSLTVEQQEKLIFKALEEAKKKNILELS